MDTDRERKSRADRQGWLDYEELPAKVISANQLVAYNMTYWRQAKGMTQEELGVLLEAFTGRPWSKATISAAERSWDGKRIRQFDADELLALAEALEVPLAGLFLAPVDDGVEARFGIVTGPGQRGEEGISTRDLVSYLVPDVSYEENENNLVEFGRRLGSDIDFHFGPGTMKEVNRFATTRPEQLRARLETLRDQREALRGLMGDIERETNWVQNEIECGGTQRDDDHQRKQELEEIRVSLHTAVESPEDAVLLERLMSASHGVLEYQRHEVRALISELVEILKSVPGPMHDELSMVVRDAIDKASDFRTPWLRLTSFCREHLDGGLGHDLATRMGARISAGEDPAAVAKDIGLSSTALSRIIWQHKVKLPDTVKWPRPDRAIN